MSRSTIRRALALATMISLALTLAWPADTQTAGVAAANPSGSAPHGFLDDSTTGSSSGGAVAATSGTPTLATGFTSSTIFSGLDHPTSIRFAGDGSVWVTLKVGKILRFASLSSTTPTVWADLSAEVDSYWDRGLMSIALAPTFPTDPTIYALYTYEHNPVHDFNPSAPTGWADNCLTPPGALTDGCPVTGRLTKLIGNAGGATWSGTESELVTGWCQQGPSHSMDDLLFGPDGFLYASAGEGSMFNVADYGQMGGTTNPVITPGNPCSDPPLPAGTVLTAPTAEGGSLRSQSVLRTDGPAVLSGTVIRIDPSTGAGVAGNPFASSSDANAKRILAYGLRNPFRFTFRPGHNDQIWIGDVGNNTWEEVDKIAVPTGGGSIAATANNFGWPCYEGNVAGLTYGVVTINQCTSLVNSGIATPPYYTYNHGAHINPSEACRTGSSSVSGAAFYTGTSYALPYRGALFFADHSRDCIWAMLPDSSGNPDPTNIVPIVTGSPTASTYWVGPVDLEVGPGGDIFYVNLDSGTINRISYGLPSALAQADVTNGAAPLTVHFDGTASADPAGGGLTYSWSVPGGTCDSLTASKPVCSFGIGTWQVTVTVTDVNNAQSTSPPVTITAGDTPPAPVIDTIDGSAPPTQPTGPLPPPGVRPNGVPAFWSVGDNITFTGHAADTQDGTEPSSRLSWQLIMHHCPSDCHLHFLQTWNGTASGSVAAPDHEYPSYLELMLTATDAQGLTASTSIYLYPKTAVLHLRTSPAGLQLTADTTTVTAPADLTFIDGSTVSLGVPGTQSIGGNPYMLWGWSDGGAASHNVTAHDGATYTASYVAQGGTYHAITPVRLVDSRINLGLTRLFSGTPLTFPVAGLHGIPSNAVGITGNVTSVGSSNGGYIALTPVPVALPPTSTLNFPTADIRANGVTMALGPSGTVTALYIGGNGQDGNSTDIVFDVTGYFTNDVTGSTYHAMTPARILDSRVSQGGSLFHSQVKQTLAVTGTAGVPSGAVGVTGNVTVVDETSGGYVSVAPSLTSGIQPGTSTINFPFADTRANGITVPLSVSGTIDLMYWTAHTADTTDVIFDLTGYFTNDPSGATYHAITPARLVDSRVSLALVRMTSGSPQTFAVVGHAAIPSNAVGITGNVTSVGSTNGGYIALTPVAVALPPTSNLNFPTADIRANAVTMALGPSGTVAALYIGGDGHDGNRTDIVFDVTGYFTS